MPKRNLILIAAIVAAAAAVVIVTRNPSSQVIVMLGKQDKPVELAEAWHVIKDKYRHPVNDQKLLCDAIGGMVAGLDEFSHYFPPGQTDAFNRRMQGVYQGLGLKVEIIDGAVVVIGPLPNSPAYHANIRTGDKILAADGKQLAGLTIEQVQEALDCGAHDEIELTIEHRGRVITRTLTGGNLPVETVVGLYRDRAGNWVHVLDPNSGIAYVRVKEFVPDTPDRIEQIVRGTGMPRGIVLDLRDNPGGLLLSAVATANLFVRQGVIVSSVGRTGQWQVHRARAEKALPPTIPVVVLINAQTASAAEIVAGALSVHNRAVLVGTRTRGKGCVQTMFALRGGLGSINLTTAEYYLDGRLPISRHTGSDNWGVDPHVQTMLMNGEELDDLRVRAEVLFQPTPETMPASWPDDDLGMAPMFLRLDTQLTEALRLIGHQAEMKALLREADAMRTRRQAAATQSSSGSRDD